MLDTSRRNFRRGFTLVELGVVLFFLLLVVAGVILVITLGFMTTLMLYASFVIVWGCLTGIKSMYGVFLRNARYSSTLGLLGGVFGGLILAVPFAGAVVAGLYLSWTTYYDMFWFGILILFVFETVITSPFYVIQSRTTEKVATERSPYYGG